LDIFGQANTRNRTLLGMIVVDHLNLTDRNPDEDFIIGSIQR